MAHEPRLPDFAIEKDYVHLLNGELSDYELVVIEGWPADEMLVTEVSSLFLKHYGL
jgi:hypothetical protein